MSKIRNDELYKLQSDYVNGTGTYGPVLEKYSNILSRYKELFAKCIPFQAVGLNVISYVNNT